MYYNYVYNVKLLNQKIKYLLLYLTMTQLDFR